MVYKKSKLAEGMNNLLDITKKPKAAEPKAVAPDAQAMAGYKGSPNAPATSLNLEADPEPGIQNTSFNQDGSVTITDVWGGTKSYGSRKEYEAGEKVNTAGPMGGTMGGQAGKTLEDKKGMVKERNIQKVMAENIQGKQELAPNIDTSVKPTLSEVGLNVGVNSAAAAGGAAIAGLSAPLAAAAVGGAALLGAKSIVAELKQDAIQNTKVQYKTLITSESNLKEIVSAVSNGQLDPIEGLRLYNRELLAIDQAEANLRKLEERSWSKAKDELIVIESFNRFGRQQLNRMMATAVVAPGTQNVAYNNNFKEETVLE